MIGRVAFEAQSLLQPRLKLRIVGLDRVGHDADRRAAVDLLESLQDRPQIRLVLGRVAHVVDGQHDHALDAFRTNPLRRDELREILVRIPDLVRVEIRQPVAIARQREDIDRQNREESQQVSHEKFLENTAASDGDRITTRASWRAVLSRAIKGV